MGALSWIMRIFGVSTGIAGLAIVALYLFQEKMLYVPRIPGVAANHWIDPVKYKLKHEDLEIITSDGVRLHAWLLWDPAWDAEYLKSRPIVMFFQENAGNMSFRLPFLRLLVTRLRCPVFALSYRGYGRSEGSPNERGLKLDAEAGLAYLATRTDLDTQRVVVFGRSLGGAVATHLAAHFPEKVSGLVIENAFASVEDMVKQIVPPLGMLIGRGRPMNWLVTNKWRNYDTIRRVQPTTPILMLVSLLDEMVPPEQMHILYNAAKAGGGQVSLVEFPNAHHMDAYDAEPVPYWAALRTYFDAHVERR